MTNLTLTVDEEILRTARIRALELGTSVISLRDALILEAANWAGCDRVLSEDLNAGQVMHGVRIENPCDTGPQA